MKKLILLTILFLSSIHLKVNAEGKAKLKVGNIGVKLDSKIIGQNINLSVIDENSFTTKEDDLQFLDFHFEQDIPGLDDTLDLSLSFLINRGDLFEKKVKLQEIPNPENNEESFKNISVNFFKNKGKRSFWYISEDDSRAKAKLIIKKFNRRTRKIQGIIKGSFSPATLRITKGLLTSEEIVDKETPFNIKFSIVLEFI